MNQPTKLKNLQLFEDFHKEEIEIENIEEGLFASAEDKKKELEADFKKYQNAWAKKGYKITKEQYDAEMKKAEKDKFKGKWGIDAKNKSIIYRNEDEIAWGSTQHVFGSGE